MQVGKDTISWREWADEPTITPGSRKNRRTMIQHLIRSNHCDTIEQLFDRIKSDNLTVYSASKRLVDSILKTHAIQTVYGYRSFLPGLWMSVLGEDNFRRTVFDRLVPLQAVYPVTIKKIPTPDGVRSMLRMANPQYKALIGVLTSGMRIGEALSRKWTDLEIRKEGYARVRMQAKETKARYLRYSFLTRETMEWIRVYTDWLGVNSEYVFPGENPIKALQYGTALEQIKRLFDRNGMKDNGPEIYTPHSFRTFADGQMRKSGMDSKYVSAIIGHTNKLQSEIAYIDWSEVEKEFFEKVEPKMTWLSDSILHARIEEEKTKNANLQTLLTTALTPDQIEKLKDFLAREIKR